MNFKRKNYDDVFFRDLTICTLATFEERLTWVNKFENVEKQITVPMYYSLTGSEDFLLDSFTDDVVSNVRKVELNTDLIPRGHITLSSWSVKSDEFCNPNTWFKKVVENEDEIKKELTRLRAIPIQANYNCTIKLESELDISKCNEAILNSMWFYKYMYFEHNFMHIDAIIQIPNDKNITIQREKTMTSDNTIKIDFDFEVHTYYPSYNESQTVGKPRGVNWVNQINSSKTQK